MWPWRSAKSEPLPKARLEAVEDDLRRLRHHVEDLEDVLGRRVDKLMHRARREQQEAAGGDSSPAGPDTEQIPARADKRTLGHLILRRSSGLLR